MKEERRCINCSHNKRSGHDVEVQCHCDIDGHDIGYAEAQEHWCPKWKRESDD